MSKIIVAISLSLFCVAALADPCMDADVSPLGYQDAATTDEIHMEEHGC